MGSHRISFWREKNPGMSDYQLTEQLSSINPRDGAVIVRYRSETDRAYDQFGSCADDEELLSYFSSKYCHDTEILYVHPHVPLSKIPPGLRITDDAPIDTDVSRLKQLRRQYERQSNNERLLYLYKPTLGVFLDINKLLQKCGAASYGFVGWKIIWGAIDVQNLKGPTYLFDGDTRSTLTGFERVWCAVFQSDNKDNLSYIRSCLENCSELKAVAAATMFKENESAATQPLPESGCITSRGRWKGKTIYDSYRVLDSLGLVTTKRWWHLWK